MPKKQHFCRKFLLYKISLRAHLYHYNSLMDFCRIFVIQRVQHAIEISVVNFFLFQRLNEFLKVKFFVSEHAYQFNCWKTYRP